MFGPRVRAGLVVWSCTASVTVTEGRVPRVTAGLVSRPGALVGEPLVGGALDGVPFVGVASVTWFSAWGAV